jgi:pyruvate/2-oxoglutarate dehydrogenase complex dihydrolipoamide dehydrogenase (E3) component
MTDRYDVIVIGSGGGGTLTHALASTGKRSRLLSASGRAMAGAVPQAAGVSGRA